MLLLVNIYYTYYYLPKLIPQLTAIQLTFDVGHATLNNKM